MIDNIFFQISIILGITAVLAFVVRLLRQPLLISYIISGIIAGPILLNFVQKDNVSYHLFSEFGIVLLLFVIGLSLNFNYLKKIGKVAVITGLGQAALTALLGFFLLKSLGLPLFASLYLSIAITFSSTIIISKLLASKKDTESVYGRYTLGIMLVQDIIAIGIMIFMVGGGTGTGIDLLHSVTLLALKASSIALLIYSLSKFVIPLLLNHIAKSAEFLFLFTVAWCFGITSLVAAAGLSLEIGAIIAGLSLGSSPYQPEISSRIRPLRDFFLILFFIILGSSINIANLESALFPALVLSLFVILIKPSILYIIFRLLKFTRRNSFLSATTAAQVSEFGFVLLFTAENLKLTRDSEFAIFTLVALITIFVSSYIITYNEQLYRFCIPFFNLFGKDKYQQEENNIPIYDAWVIGHHRMGWKVCQALKNQGLSFAIIDFNPETVQQLKKENYHVYFGDVADVEFLSELPLEKAKLIISTIPEPDDQMTLVKHIRAHSEKPHIIANLTHIRHLDDLYNAGANYVMMPHLLGGYRLAEILSEKISRTTFNKLRHEQKQEIAMRFEANTHD